MKVGIAAYCAIDEFRKYAGVGEGAICRVIERGPDDAADVVG